MTICTKNGDRSVNFGTSTVWDLFVAMLHKNIKDFDDEFPNVLAFFTTFRCNSDCSVKTASQLKAIRKILGEIPSDRPGISCAEYFTTVDGDDLITGLIELLEYSAQNNTDVIPCF